MKKTRWWIAIAALALLVFYFLRYLNAPLSDLKEEEATKKYDKAAPAASVWTLPPEKKEETKEKPITSLRQELSAIPRPDVVSAEAWADVLENIESSPDGAAKAKSLASFVTYHQNFQEWRSLRHSGESPERRAVLTKMLLEATPSRVAQGELAGYEAKALMAALIGDSVSDPVLQQQMVQSEIEKLDQAVPHQYAKEEQSTDVAARQKKEREIIAEWLSQPAEKRSQDALENKLAMVTQGL